MDNTKEILDYILGPDVDTSSLYQPIIVDDVLVFDFKKRSHAEQLKKRISLFPSFKNESIIDIGCHTGYILQQLIKYKEASKCYGLEPSRLQHSISKKIAKIERNNIFYALGSVEDLGDISFENSLFLSVTSPMENHYGLDFMKAMDKIREVTKKSIFVEPTNHRSDSVEFMKNYYDEYLSRWGTPILLGTTDYQNRVLYRIDVNVN